MYIQDTKEPGLAEKLSAAMLVLLVIINNGSKLQKNSQSHDKYEQTIHKFFQKNISNGLV